MNLDGTDWLVLLTVILVILALLTFLATFWPKWKKRRAEPGATLIYPMPATSGKNAETIPKPRDYPPDAADNPPRTPTNFASPFPPLKRAASLAEEPAPVADRQTSASPKPRRRKLKPHSPSPASAQWQDLLDDTVTVPAGYGQHWATRLDLEAGDEVRGTLTEVDDDDFSYMVLDESNYAAFRGGNDFEVVDEAEDTSSVRVDFSVDEADRYYLVLYAYGKQNDREVEVSIRARTRNS